MAIQKSKTLPNGATGNYWKITLASCDRLSLKCTWQITLFADQTHADNGSPSLGLTKTFIFPVTKQEAAGDLTALGYTKIKAKAASTMGSLFPRLTSQEASSLFDSDLANGTDV